MLAAMKRIVLLGLVLGCSNNSARSVDAPSQDGATGDVPGAALAVTSTAFVDGGAIPIDDTCKGANTSPVLAWTGAPSDTKSFAVVLTDLSINLVHWVIYDIPATATGLPAAVENVYAPGAVAGAHQTVSVHAPVVGYYGPCPPVMHTYQFAVYALDVAPLPGATATTMRPEAIAAIQAHRLGGGTLTGTFTP
jgi:Raf kinase inhibitor-like YbhB/YbcL family protein